MNDYIDPVLKKYADTIKTYMPGIVRVYYGDPMRIGVSELPAMILTKVNTSVKNMSNEEDRHDMRISITIVTDVRDTLGEDKLMVKGVSALYNLMEGRDANYQLKPTSLLYAIRHNVELDTGNNLRTDLDTISRIDYGMTVGKRQKDAWAIEGRLELTATFTQVR